MDGSVVQDIIIKLKNPSLDNKLNLENILNVTKYLANSKLVNIEFTQLHNGTNIEVQQLHNGTVNMKKSSLNDHQLSSSDDKNDSHLGSLTHPSNQMMKKNGTEEKLENLQTNLRSLQQENVPVTDSKDFSQAFEMKGENLQKKITKIEDKVTTEENDLKNGDIKDLIISTSSVDSVTDHSRVYTVLPILNSTMTSKETSMQAESSKTNKDLIHKLLEQNASNSESKVKTVSKDTEATFNVSPSSVQSQSQDIVIEDKAFYPYNNSFAHKTVLPKIKNSDSQTTFVGAESPVLTQNNLSFYFNDFSSSIVLSVGLSFAFALVLFVLITLWIIRKRKYHSKVYLNYELAKHSRHLSKPLPPNILPREILLDNHSIPKNDSSKEPLHLQHDKVVNTDSTNKYSNSFGNNNSGIDNPAFIGHSAGQENSSSDDKKGRPVFIKTVKKDVAKNRRLIPKYTKKRKTGLEFPTPRVCSSDGSIFPASPSLTRCLVPPPPYSPSVRNEIKQIFTLPNGPIGENKSKVNCESSH